MEGLPRLQRNGSCGTCRCDRGKVEVEYDRPGVDEIAAGRDRTRAESPLQPAPDAVIIDSTHLALDEVVAQVEAIIRERL